MRDTLLMRYAVSECPLIYSCNPLTRFQFCCHSTPITRAQSAQLVVSNKIELSPVRLKHIPQNCVSLQSVVNFKQRFKPY